MSKKLEFFSKKPEFLAKIDDVRECQKNSSFLAKNPDLHSEED